MEQKPRIGIVGGRGKMGQWFSRWFKQQGYNVLLADLKTQLSNTDLVEQSDVVIFSLPIRITPRIINGLKGKSRPDQLWMDLTSIKVAPVKAMLRSQAEVVGLHPMFGPSVDTVQGQTVAVCDVRTNRWQGWIEQLLTKSGAQVKQTDPETHDRMMTVVQGITHFSVFAMAHAYKDLDLDILESLSYTSPVYKIQLDMIGRYLAQDPKLYADIQIDNPYTKETLNTLMQSMAKLYRIVEESDRAAFTRYVKQASRHAGEYTETALRDSDRLIRAAIGGAESEEE